MDYIRKAAKSGGKAMLKSALKQAGLLPSAKKKKSPNLTYEPKATPRSRGSRNRGAMGAGGTVRGREASRSAQLRSQHAQLQVAVVATGPNVDFREARSGNAKGLALSGSQAWCDVLQTDLTNKVLGLPGETDEAKVYNYFPFDINSATSMPDPLQALADLFVRFRLKRLRLRYAPAVPTTDTSVFTLAWVNDPNVTATTFNTFKKVQGIQDSLTFPAYEPWAMEVAIDDFEMRYVDNDSSDTRFAVPGQIVGCIATAGATDVVTRKGTIFIDYEIDLFQLFNITGTSLMCECGRVADRCDLRRRFQERVGEEKKREAKMIRSILDLRSIQGPPNQQEQKQEAVSLTSFARAGEGVGDTELQDLQKPVLRRADAFVVVNTPKQAASTSQKGSKT
jgi:hypothetical protein